jgi:hypothetical protein
VAIEDGIGEGHAAAGHGGGRRVMQRDRLSADEQTVRHG